MAWLQADGSASTRWAIGSMTPALLIKASIGPKRSVTVSMAWKKAAASATLSGSAIALLPICAASPSILPDERAKRATFAPRAVHSNAVAAPMPMLAPVITMV